MVEIILRSLFHKILAKFDLLVLRPIDWSYWKPASSGSIRLDSGNVEKLTAMLGYSFKNEKDKAFFAHRFSGYDAVLSGAVLDARHGWVISGRQIHPLSFFNINDPYDGRKRYPSVINYLLARLFARFIKANEVVWLPRLWNNYYHFVIELLPVLLEIKRSGKRVTILGCSATEFPYVQFFADKMHLLDCIRFVPIDKARFYKAQTVHLKKQPLFDDAFLKDLHSFITDVAQHGPAEYHEKVFIYRKGMRSLRNNQVLLDLLQGQGFFCFDPGDHPVGFQVAALRQAKVVVGVHGAGLTNVLFSSSLERLVELMPANMRPNHYREIAVVKGAGYFCLQGSTLDEQLTFAIDPEKLVGALQLQNA